MKVLIELPDVIKDDDGVEYEPVGEWRVPKIGEYYLDTECRVCIEKEGRGAAIVLRKKFVWPEWLGGYAIAKDDGGGIWMYHQEIEIDSHRWVQIDESPEGIKTFIQIQPWMFPTLDLDTLLADWTKPLLNPNYKAPQE